MELNDSEKILILEAKVSKLERELASLVSNRYHQYWPSTVPPFLDPIPHNGGIYNCKANNDAL